MIDSGDDLWPGPSALGGVSSSHHPVLLPSFPPVLLSSCPPVEISASRNPGPVLSVAVIDVVRADISNFKIADDLINQLVFSLLFEL